MILLKQKINKHIRMLIGIAERREIDILSMGSHKLFEDEVSIELHPHHWIDIAPIDILYYHNEVVSQNNRLVFELYANRITLEDCVVVETLENYLLFRTDFN